MKKGIVMEISGRFLTVLTPDGEFLRAHKHDNQYEIGQEINFSPIEKEVNSPSRILSIFNIFPKKSLVVTFVACMLVLLSIFPIYQNNQVYAYMSIDINPSLELAVNKKYQVLEIIPYNHEGKEITSELDDWKKKDVSVVTEDILQAIKNQGYLKKNNKVLVSTVMVQDKQENKTDKRLNQQMDKIKDEFNNEKLELTYVNGTEKERKQAKKMGITTGKYKKLQTNNPERKEKQNVNTNNSTSKKEIVEKKKDEKASIKKPIEKEIGNSKQEKSEITKQPVQEKSEKVKKEKIKDQAKNQHRDSINSKQNQQKTMPNQQTKEKSSVEKNSNKRNQQMKKAKE